MDNGQLEFAPDESLRSHQTREVLVASLVWIVATVVLGTLGWILFEIVGQGISQLSWTFLTAEVEDAGRAGGIGPVILSTTLILLVTLAIALPLSLATAIALTEKPDQNTKFSRTIRHSLDILAGVPSIVFGLFGNAFFAIVLGLGYSILTGGLTLACMILPLLIRATEQSILAVPNDYRYAAACLGLGRTATLFRVVLPAAMPGLVAGIVLSVGRALAETAALIFTAGYASRAPESLMDSGRSLSVHVYDLAMNVPGGSSRAYASACVLILLLLMVNTITSLLSRYASAAQKRSAGGIRL